MQMAVRPGFETISLQHAAYAQQRSYSIHAEPFSSTPKLSQQKKDSADRQSQSNVSHLDSTIELLECCSYPWTSTT